MAAGAEERERGSAREESEKGDNGGVGGQDKLGEAGAQIMLHHSGAAHRSYNRHGCTVDGQVMGMVHPSTPLLIMSAKCQLDQPTTTGGHGHDMVVRCVNEMVPHDEAANGRHWDTQL